jgi:hypothetical protein
MTTITLEGKEYQLDIEQAKQLGLLKEKDNKVKSWEEFIEKYRYKYSYYYDVNENTVRRTSTLCLGDQLAPHEAKALAAFSKLLKLRRDWIGEWEPDWEDGSTKYGVSYYGGRLLILEWCNTSCALPFQTAQMAKDFLETFRDLIEEAKILI